MAITLPRASGDPYDARQAGKGRHPTGASDAGLAARMHAARQATFVGRRAELNLFGDALAAEGSPFAVLHVHGPGGVGKSALLARFAHLAEEADRHVVRLDGRAVDPSPEGLLGALARAFEVGEGEGLDRLADVRGLVLLVDTYELLAPVDGWVRDTLVPGLAEDAMVVLAGREQPSAGWRADPAWSQLLRVTALRDLPADDARALLATRGVDPDQHDAVLRVAHGHPLALSLVADVAGARDVPHTLADAPEVIDALLAQLVRHVPTDAHRRALYAAAHVGIATEALLRDTIDDAPADELFDWLVTRSFTEPVASGLAVHDLVSEALNAELAWRDPEGWANLHIAVSAHFERRTAQATGSARTRAMLDLLQLYRLDPATRRFFDWDRRQPLWLEPARPDDHPTIVNLARVHEGDASAALATWWLERQPQAFDVFRGPHGDEPAGFVAHLLLEDTPGDEVDVDPVAAAVWRHVRVHAPLRSGECLRILRFWVARDTYQDIATHHLVATRASLDWTGTPHLAMGIVVLSDTDFYEEIFRFIDFTRPDDLLVDVGDGHCVSMFARDFRVTSQRAWRQLIRDRRMRRGPAPAVPQPTRLLVLEREEFAEAVRDALRGLARPGGLQGNPLLRSRVVRDHANGRPAAHTLADMLVEQADELSVHPRDAPKQRALDLTYFHPAPTQLAAAERLDLPFSTFRRHLVAGIDHLVDRLWELELHGSTSVSHR